jgi:hypothetical protein
MTRRSTFWEDLGLGLLAGAIILLTAASWALIADVGGLARMNRLEPSSADLYVATPVGPSERKVQGLRGQGARFS